MQWTVRSFYPVTGRTVVRDLYGADAFTTAAVLRAHGCRVDIVNPALAKRLGW